MKDRSLFGIVPCVVISHLVAIFWLVSTYTWNPPSPPPKAVVVKTVKLSPPVIAALEPSAPLTPPKVEPSAELKAPEVKPSKELKPPEVKPSPPLPPPKPKSLPAPKALPKPQALPKKTTPKTEAPKPAPGPSPAEIAAKTKQKELLSQAKEKMGKINKGNQEIGLATPGKIESLQSAGITIDSGGTYQDLLGYHLKRLLKLPKYGEVKVRLTLDRSGQVTKVAIQSYQNEENKVYLEKELLKTMLPAFGSHFPGEENHTFSITLSNET